MTISFFSLPGSQRSNLLFSLLLAKSNFGREDFLHCGEIVASLSHQLFLAIFEDSGDKHGALGAAAEYG